MTAAVVVDLVLFLLGGLVKNTRTDLDDDLLDYVRAAYVNIKKAKEMPVSKSRLESWEVKVPW